jgi:hypothetical protein
MHNEGSSLEQPPYIQHIFKMKEKSFSVSYRRNVLQTGSSQEMVEAFIYPTQTLQCKVISTEAITVGLQQITSSFDLHDRHALKKHCSRKEIAGLLAVKPSFSAHNYAGLIAAKKMCCSLQCVQMTPTCWSVQNIKISVSNLHVTNGVSKGKALCSM